tara:strand:- start:640 stop:1245 length:606 start_codon:yes stop_codon:yes gene_type:complete
MSHKESDTASCKTYFKYGKSFPENVRDAVCDIPEVIGQTGPTGPVGPQGPAGTIEDFGPATVDDILAGKNTDPPSYVDASGWYHASNKYAPLVDTETLLDQTYYPDAMDHNVFDLTISGNCVLGAPINMKNGRTISVVVRQHLATNGLNKLNMDPVYEFDGGYNQLTLTSGAKDVIVATKINDFYFCTLAVDIKTGINTAY